MGNNFFILYGDGNRKVAELLARGEGYQELDRAKQALRLDDLDYVTQYLFRQSGHDVNIQTTRYAVRGGKLEEKRRDEVNIHSLHRDARSALIDLLKQIKT